MPLGPTNPSHTFGDGLLRLADALGLADPTPDGDVAIPDDPYLLARLKRSYNDGLKLLAAKNPNWRCLAPPMELVIGEGSPDAIDATTYRLPWWVSTGTALTFTARADAWSGPVVVTHRDRVLRELALSSNRGYPEFGAIVPISQPDGGRIWALQIAPRPDRQYVLEGACQQQIIPLRETFERHPFGAAHDMVVLAAAKFAFVQDDADERRGRYLEDYERLVAEAIRYDSLAGGAVTLGMIRDGEGETHRPDRARSGGLVTYGAAS